MTNKRNDPKRDPNSGRPETGGGEGRVERTGIVPDDVRVDPNLTEGHPGYQESGDSEIISDKELNEDR